MKQEKKPRLNKRASPRKFRLPPDPEKKNEQRAWWVWNALGKFASETRMTGEDNITLARDFLADLAHWCDREELQLEKLLQLAHLHYSGETSGKGRQYQFFPVHLEPVDAPAKLHVVVTLEGGLVQDVLTDVPAQVCVIDYDTEGAPSDDPELSQIPQTGGGVQPAFASTWKAAVMPTRVHKLFTAVMGEDSE